jgi:hypothetical protein
MECNTLVCSECQVSNHGDHNKENIIIEVKTYIEEAATQLELFKDKFSIFLETSSTGAPINENVYKLLDEQKDIIDFMYIEQRKLITDQFDMFIKRLEMIRELEYHNLENFRNFFKDKIEEVESKLSDLLDVKNDIEEFVDGRLFDLNTFHEYDSFTREAFIKRVSDDMNVLRAKKQNIMNQFKEYNVYLIDVEKIKKYFQRSLLNLRENKTYELTKLLDNLYNDLETKFEQLNLPAYLERIIIGLDEDSLFKSRNNAPHDVKDLLIAWGNTKKILSYRAPDNLLSVIECDFKNFGFDKFLDFSRSINVQGILYINGGIENTKKSSKVHFSFKQNTIKREADMLFSHSSHSLIFVYPNYLYCISGSRTNKCEMYNITTNNWVEIPTLNSERENASLAYHNEQYIFTFGGLMWDETLQDYNLIETVERLEIGVQMNNRWELVSIIKPDGISIGKSIMAVIPISIDKILLVGGTHKDKTYSNEVILFDFETHEISLLDDLKLKKPTCFPSKHFLFFGDLAYQFDTEGEIHKFSSKDLSFKLLTSNYYE